MLTTKSDRLRASTADAPPPTFTPTTSAFEGFRPIMDSDLRSVLTSVNLKSCELDPLAPFIITDILDDIAPFFLYLFNRSLPASVLHSRFTKTSFIFFPALKKPNLDPITFVRTSDPFQTYHFSPKP